MSKMSASLDSSEAFNADELVDEAEVSREYTLVLQSIIDILGGQLPFEAFLRDQIYLSVASVTSNLALGFESLQTELFVKQLEQKADTLNKNLQKQWNDLSNRL